MVWQQKLTTETSTRRVPRSRRRCLHCSGLTFMFRVGAERPGWSYTGWRGQRVAIGQQYRCTNYMIVARGARAAAAHRVERRVIEGCMSSRQRGISIAGDVVCERSGGAQWIVTSEVSSGRMWASTTVRVNLERARTASLLLPGAVKGEARTTRLHTHRMNQRGFAARCGTRSARAGGRTCSASCL